MKNTTAQSDHPKALHDFWPWLLPWQKIILEAYAIYLLIPRLHPALEFSLRSAFGIFALLAIMPVHPMAIPIAAGGGIALALITH
jgi:hypothetical protein